MSTTNTPSVAYRNTALEFFSKIRYEFFYHSRGSSVLRAISGLRLPLSGFIPSFVRVLPPIGRRKRKKPRRVGGAHYWQDGTQEEGGMAVSAVRRLAFFFTINP